MIVASGQYKALILRFFMWAVMSCTLTLSVIVYAQTDQASSPVPSFATERNIRASLSSLDANTELTDEEKTQARELYTDALSSYEKIEDYRAQRREFQAITPAYVAQQKTEYENQLAQARADLNAPLQRDETPLTDESLLEIEQEIALIEGEADSLGQQLQFLDQRQTELSERLGSGPAERDEARQRLQTVEAAIAAYEGQPETELARARRASSYARRAAINSEIEMLSAAIIAAPLELELIPLRKDLVEARLANVVRQLKELRDRSGAYRAAEAQLKVEQSEASVELVRDLHPLLLAFAQDNLQFAVTLKEISESGGNFALQKSRLFREIRQIESDTQLAESILSEEDIGRRYATVLRQLRESLDSPRQLRSNISTRSRLRLDISMSRTLARDRLEEFPPAGLDPDVVLAEWRIDNKDARDLTPLERQIFDRLAQEQKALLTQTVSYAVRLNSELSEINTLEEQLATETEELIDLLDRELIWLPSAEPIGLDFPKRLWASLQDRFKPENSSALFQSVSRGLRAHPIFTALWMLATIIFIFAHQRMLPRLRAIVDDVGNVRQDKYSHTPFVIFAGLVAAARYAVPLFGIGYIIASGARLRMPELVGLGLMSGAQIVFLLYAVREWARPRGLFPVHFKMNTHLASRLRGNLSWFIPLQVIAVVIISICEGPFANDPASALAIIGFLASTLGLVVFVYRILYWHDGGSQIVSGESYVGRHRRSLFLAVLAIPIIISVLAFFGYLDTAIELQTRLLFTLSILIVTYLFYGLVRRTVEIAQRKTRLQDLIEQRERQAKEREERAKAEESGEEPVQAPSIDYSQINVAELSRQSSQLLNLLVFLGAGIGLYLLWSSLLPALSVLDKVTVWPYTSGAMDANNLPIVENVTLWNIVQAVAYLALTIIAARNLPGLIELFILKRFNLAESTRYGITTVVGYAIVIIGILISVQRLGLQWSSMKWVVGGLSVGIGFGLQEIIANFISGLIILMERPVRIGDWVTVGDKSGTVSRIQIRATTLTDLDNIETVIPNKELITGRVTNWTLTSPITRMTVPVGIAYGSDTAEAMHIMLEAAKGNKTVLESPSPQVIFSGFGDSSLDFEVRVFLGSFSQRVPVRHQLHMALNDALEKAGISIPFPQRDLHLVSSTVEWPGMPAQSKKKAPKSGRIAPEVREQDDDNDMDGE